MENQHEQITGYRDFDQSTVNIINEIKALEIRVADYWHEFRGGEEVDQRELALAKTHFEDAFMHWVKAVANPASAW